MARDDSAAAYLHEFIEPQVRRHNEQHAETARNLTGFVRAYDDMVEMYDQLMAQYAAQQQRLAQLEAKYARLADLVASVDARFTNLAGMWTRENHPNKQTESDHRHHDVAGEFERFLDGEVFPLVITPTKTGQILPPGEQARAYASVTRALFGSADPELDNVRTVLASFGLEESDRELGELTQLAAGITAKAAQLGRGHRWDFDQRDGKFDSARQSRYPGSADGGPGEIVTFVVAPGYLVGDGKVVVRQRVFTANAQPSQGDSQPL